ncbi:MAG TPA: glycerophosphodiester phosphodiesterase [Sedimentisphaerales bacterium]|nr:glycerophosphodiester phosphodiesterase [Sedimentisphaerales bacterium]
MSQVHLARRIKVIAHRGASHLAPENTLAAVNLAWEHGADIVEVDVHLTKDGRIVAIHDPTTERTAGAGLEVAKTHSRHLRRLDVGSHKHEDFTGETIPFLEEVLDTIPAGRHLFIEIKCGPEILAVLSEVLAQSGKRSQVAIIGFDLQTMKAAKQVMPDIPAHWLCDKKLWRPFSRSLAKTAKEHGLDGMSIHWSGVTWRFAQAMRRAGLKLYAWTVDHPADASRLHAMGVDGITTNRPGWLRRHFLAHHSRGKTPQCGPRARRQTGSVKREMGGD